MGLGRYHIHPSECGGLKVVVVMECLWYSFFFVCGSGGDDNDVRL